MERKAIKIQVQQGPMETNYNLVVVQRSDNKASLTPTKGNQRKNNKSAYTNHF